MLKQAHAQEIKIIKQLAQQRAIEFVKEAAKSIEQSFTREYRVLLKQYIAFREKMWQKIDDFDAYLKRMIQAETLTAHLLTVYDYNYCANDAPFRLYSPSIKSVKKKKKNK